MSSGPLGSAIVFFGSAAASGVNEAKQQGATEEQAVIYGTLSGLAEAAAEAFSVEKLLKNSIPPNSLKRFFKNVLRQAGVEASEEGVTSLLNNFADQLVLRDKSKFNIRIKQNIEQGMSESAAKTKAWKQLFNDLLYDMLGGFVSGGVSVGVETGFKTASSVAVDITPYADYDNITNQGGTVNANTQHQGGSLHSGGIQWNAQGDTQGQAARGTANGGRNVRSGNQSGLYGENGKRNVHTSDSEGRTLSPQQRSELHGTAVTDSTGAPLALYHATDNMEFTTFEKGDTGFHFGSAEQAEAHSKNRNYSTGRTFRAYLNIKNPVQMNRDIMGWHPGGTALRLWGDGVLTDAEKNDITDLYKIGDGYDSASAVLLRKILESKGYDGIAYPNGFEGDGTSYIAFHDSQIIKTDINTFGATDTLTGRETLAQTVDSVDINLLDPRLRQDVRDYRTHWQKLQTTQSLLQQEQSKLQQLQQANGSAYEIQSTKSKIQKLNQILSREQRTLQSLEQKPALQQVLKDARARANPEKQMGMGKEGIAHTIENYLQAFKPNSDYRKVSGEFDVERVKSDYGAFLTTIPRKHRMYLQQSLDSVEYRNKELKRAAFGYSGLEDVIFFDPTKEEFWDMDFAVANTHELAHRIDSFFVNSSDSANFRNAIQNAKKIIDADPGKFIEYSKKNDMDGFLSDIFSAIAEGEYKFYAGHPVEYWQKLGNKEKEIFANLFSLEAYQDQEKIDFIREYFSELYEAYKNFEY